MKAMKKTVDKPTFGSASAAMSQGDPCIHRSGLCEPLNQGVAPRKSADFAPLYCCLVSAADSPSLLRIGHITLANRLFAAPMGRGSPTDRFASSAERLGAGYAVSEMVTSRKDLWATLKTSRRADHEARPIPSPCRSPAPARR